jgi:hypothetical protein
MKVVELKEKKKFPQATIDFINEILSKQDDIDSLFICYSRKENGAKVNKYVVEAIDFNDAFGLIELSKIHYLNQLR